MVVIFHPLHANNGTKHWNDDNYKYTLLAVRKTEVDVDMIPLLSFIT